MKRMAAAGLDFDSAPVGADRGLKQIPQIEIKRNHFRNIGVLLKDRFRALQIPQPLLAGICGKKQAVLCILRRIHEQIFNAHQQIDQVCSVVPDSGGF